MWSIWMMRFHALHPVDSSCRESVMFLDKTSQEHPDETASLTTCPWGQTVWHDGRRARGSKNFSSNIFHDAFLLHMP
jgi:hypothetical protein